jgi:hypothetical protein
MSPYPQLTGSADQDQSSIANFLRRQLDGLCALAELSPEAWSGALAVLRASSDDDAPGVVSERLKSAVPAPARYAGYLLAEVTCGNPVARADPVRETAEMLASQVWGELGGPGTAVLVERLEALLRLPWAVHRRALDARHSWPAPHRDRDTSEALRRVGALPVEVWRAALLVLSAGVPPHEVYARFAAAAPGLTLGYTQRLLFDVVYLPRRLVSRRLVLHPGQRMSDALVSSFAGELDADQRALLFSRLEALISTPWVADRLAATGAGR